MDEAWISGVVAATAKHIFGWLNLRVPEIRGGRSTHYGRELLMITWMILTPTYVRHNPTVSSIGERTHERDSHGYAHSWHIFIKLYCDFPRFVQIFAEQECTFTVPTQFESSLYSIFFGHDPFSIGIKFYIHHFLYVLSKAEHPLYINMVYKWHDLSFIRLYPS